MTACRNKASRAVTAALVGVLSVGAVPMVALAQTGDGASIMALSPADAFDKGTLAATDGQGNEVTFPAKDLVSFTTGTGKYLLPTSITADGVDPIELSFLSGSGNATVTYYKGQTAEGGSLGAKVAEAGRGLIDTASTHDWAAGTYTAVIEYVGEGQYKGEERYVSFKVVDVDLESATVFNATNGDDPANTSFTYNGQAQKYGIAVDGEVVDLDDYSVVLYKDGASDGVDTTHEVTDAGNYTVYLRKGGALVATVDFAVEKLNLSEASVSVADVKQGAVSTTTMTAVANGVVLTDGSAVGANVVDITPDANDGAPVGQRYATVKALEGDTNIEGSARVKFNIVGTLVDTGYTYEGTSFDSGLTVPVDLGKGESFDEDEIKVATLDAKEFDVTYAKEDGSEATLADLSQPGTYYVNVRVNAERSGYAKGSATHTITVVVSGPSVSSNDVIFSYKGEAAGSTLTGITYDGSDHLDDIKVTVKYDGKTLTEGEDYEVVVTDTATGDEVESIVDAGNYEIEVKSDKYDIAAGNKLTVTVDKVQIGYIYAKSDLMKTFGDITLVPYTGEDIDADFTFGYYEKDGKVVAEGTDGAIWVELPEGSVRADGIKWLEKANRVDTQGTGSSAVTTESFDWNATSTGNFNGSTSSWVISALPKTVDGLKDKGYYKVFVSLTKDAKNYQLTSGNAFVNNDVLVSEDKVFADVPNDAWYAGSVYAAREQGYIFGYNGGQVFGPADSMTRADVAVVLYRMSGGTLSNYEGQFSEMSGYDTGYVDCDNHAYYAQAVAWARKAGIVAGYDSTHFGPTDTVTREQFATMLANYAKVTGDFEAADESVLDKYGDGSSVSSFAKGTVAWAVENGVMGGASALRPTDPVSRADAATMAINYQPERLDNSGILS